MENSNIQNPVFEEKDRALLNPALSENFNNDLEKYKAFINSSDIGAWEYFLDGDFVSCNDIYFSMLGRDINDYCRSGCARLKTAWTDLLHPDDKTAATTCFNEYLKNPVGRYENYFRMAHHDGSWVWIWSRGSILKTNDGHQAVIGTHLDITAHKKAEEAIQQERILLRTLIDSLPDVIYVKDIEGRKIIANPADVKSIGFKTEEEVLGKTDLELFNHSNIGKRGYEDDMRVLAGQPIINREEYFIDAGKKKRWLLTTKIPVRDELGQIIRLLGIGHDITARKQSEEVLNKLNEDLFKQSLELSKQADHLKALNKELELQKEQELEKALAQGKFEIASEVLHDIGNAMIGLGSHLNRINYTVEQNNLDNLRKLCVFLKGQQPLIAGAIGENKAAALISLTEGIVKTQSNGQEEARQSVNELQNIITHIQEILNIQRQLVKGHGGVHQRKPVNLANIIDDCRSMLFASFEKKGIQLKTNIRPGDYTIRGDHTKLMQVILNILKNSVEAIDFDATEKKITIEMQNKGNEIELIIADNGLGFDAETGQRLFERGFTTKKSGTGLGLYNCRSIVESHNGTFDVKSEGPGLGAVIIIKFAF